MSVQKKEEEMEVDDIMERPNDGARYVVVVGSLRGFVTAHFEVKLFVLKKSWSGSAFRCLGSLFSIRSKAAYDTRRQKFTFNVKRAA